MNAEIRRVAFVALMLLAVLVVGTTYWQAWAAGDLAARQDNAIKRVAEFKIRRGLIYASDGTVLAANRRRKVNGEAFYFRRYPERLLASNVVGYSTQGRSRAGVERSLNDYLTGSNANLRTVVRTTVDELLGKTVVGNSVVLTIDPEIQRAAQRALGTNCGAAVAIEPSTGRVLAMATSPSYDPNLIETEFERITRRVAACRPAAPLFNRATAGLYAPGSTFKVVTAAAAMDPGHVTPDTSFFDPGFCVEYGKPVNNYDTSRPFGRLSFAQAMQYSVNSVFCNVGKDMGGVEIVDFMPRFGFYALPGLETPESEQRISGLYEDGKPFRPKRDFQVDPGRLAFGQERLAITPFQMAMVVAAVANDGVLMKPYLVEQILTPGGKVLKETEPKEVGRVMKRSTAESLTDMMTLVVSSGTGTAAQIPGVEVAGKTGTAETGVAGRNTTWFVAFAPARKATVAVAVALENQSGTGGTTAAPIAREIMTTALRRSAAP
jgi:peptidoglycan glycosyltransferase